MTGTDTSLYPHLQIGQHIEACTWRRAYHDITELTTTWYKLSIGSCDYTDLLWWNNVHNFCYTIENISFWGCREQKMVQSERRMTSFIKNLMNGVLLIHGQERVQISTKQLTLIWDSISSSKVHCQINIIRFNMHIVGTYMKTGILQQRKGIAARNTYLTVISLTWFQNIKISIASNTFWAQSILYCWSSWRPVRGYVTCNVYLH